MKIKIKTKYNSMKFKKKNYVYDICSSNNHSEGQDQRLYYKKQGEIFQ